jgi:hypothetical protein
MKRTWQEVLALLEQPGWWKRAFIRQVVRGKGLTEDETLTREKYLKQGSMRNPNG